MKYSRFTLFFEKNAKTILFNTLNKKMQIVPSEILASDINNSEILKRQFSDFIVKDDAEDDQNQEYLFNSMAYQSTRLSLTLMMTMSCNFKCVYCFESWISKEERCTELKEDEVIDWIIWLVKKYHIKEVDLCFHGGEPLIKVEKIEKIGMKLKTFFLSNMIFYRFTIVTNGYLLNAENIDILKKVDIKIAQITIDGIGDVHDKRRPLANGIGTFQTIIDNLKNNYFLKMYVNVVYDTENASNVFDLIDYFYEHNLQSKIGFIILSATKPTLESKNINDFQLSQQEGARLRVHLIEYITDRGFKVPFDVDYQLCTMKQKSSFVLTPDGMMYKCISGVGKDPFKIGYLKVGDDPFKTQPHIISREKDKGCQKCPYSPICNQFCLYESYVMRCSKICQKEYWREFLSQYFHMYLASKNKDNFVVNTTRDEWEMCDYE